MALQNVKHLEWNLLCSPGLLRTHNPPASASQKYEGVIVQVSLFLLSVRLLGLHAGALTLTQNEFLLFSCSTSVYPAFLFAEQIYSWSVNVLQIALILQAASRAGDSG